MIFSKLVFFASNPPLKILLHTLKKRDLTQNFNNLIMDQEFKQGTITQIYINLQITMLCHMREVITIYHFVKNRDLDST